MANYDLIFPGTVIDDILKTGYDLQNAGYIFRGLASGYTGTPSHRSWVIAGEGETGHGLTSAVPAGSIGICMYDGSSWTARIVSVLGLDSTPTTGSGNAVSSGGVAAALSSLSVAISQSLESMRFTDSTPAADQGRMLGWTVTMTAGGVMHTITTFGLLAATASKAGLMSAEDKQKVDGFLETLQSMGFEDTTPTADAGTKIVETLSMEIGGVETAVTALTILAATASKAGLMSASDKAYLDGIPESLSSIGSSIDSVEYDISRLMAMLGYYVCDTAAGTAAKDVYAAGYRLTTGGCIRIKMTNANTADNVTLNINSTGAKALYYNGEQASSSNSWEAGETLEVYYDGTQYQCASGGGGEVKVEDVSNVDLAISDMNRRPIAIFKNGHVRTKNFDSASTPLQLDKENTDLDISDVNGNTVVKFKNGHIITRLFNSSQFNPNIIPVEASPENKLADRDWVAAKFGTQKKTINILFLGNSLTQDSVSYLPLILREIAPELTFKLYDAYNAGITLANQYSNYLLTDTPFTIFSIYDSELGTSWVNYNNSKNISWILENCNFDIVVLQEYSYYTFSESDETSYYNNIVNFFEKNYSKAVEFVTLIDAPNRSKVESMFALAQQYAGWHLKNTNCQSVVAPGAAVYYALQTSLDNLGDQGHLSPDGTHTQEGLPCLLQAYVHAMWIFERLGIAKSICGSKTRITQTVYNSLNVPGPNLGSGVITGTDEQHYIAQECAVKASKLAKKIEINILSNFN